MKKLIGISVVALVALLIAYPSLSSSVSQVAVDNGINFIEQDFDKALAKAKAEDKIIFVDTYASWCGPCKMMDKKVFRDKKVADYFNANFVNLKMMVETSTEVTPEGNKFVQRYDFDAYPTMFFLDKEGKVVHKIVGYHAADSLLLVGQSLF